MFSILISNYLWTTESTIHNGYLVNLLMLCPLTGAGCFVYICLIPADDNVR